MYSLKIPLDNVSLRAFLYLLDDRNLKRELSNTTISEYVLKHYRAIPDRYKDRRSFRSGYAGNLSLIFDSSDAQAARLNKFTKVLPPALRQCLKRQSGVQIQLDERHCQISRITREDDYQLLAVFFCLKPINANLNRYVGIEDPTKGWLNLISRELEMPIRQLEPLCATQTGRGDLGRRAILNRKTIHNRGGVWFDVSQPAYHDFENLRHKVFLHSLLMEQSNYLIAIPILTNYKVPYQTIFTNNIKVIDDEPSLNTSNGPLVQIDHIHLIRRDELRDNLLLNMPVPKSYQYNFYIDNSQMLFNNGYVVALAQFTTVDRHVLKSMKSISPTVTPDSKLESEIKESVKRQINNHSLMARISRIGTHSQESETVARFGALSNSGSLKLQDYTRSSDGIILFAKKKTCLIIYTGTDYPDLICIFAEDAERIDRQSDLSFEEYIEHIRSNIARFRHLAFGVEVEYNLSSFRIHDLNAKAAERSKYIFYESGSGNIYRSRAGFDIPAIRLAEVAL